MVRIWEPTAPVQPNTRAVVIVWDMRDWEIVSGLCEEGEGCLGGKTGIGGWQFEVATIGTRL